MDLLIATHNRHKLDEIRAIFHVPGLNLLSVDDVPGLPEVVEDGTTLEANAIKKAETLARVSGLWALADDSGLEVDALDGAPGVFSARFAGEDGNALANTEKLLRVLTGVEDRGARFRCVIALARSGAKTETVSGACEGTIVHSPCGDGGFGYDPVFQPTGESRTFAEMKDHEKNAISHRGRALDAARTAWLDLLTH